MDYAMEDGKRQSSKWTLAVITHLLFIFSCLSLYLLTLSPSVQDEGVCDNGIVLPMDVPSVL